MEDTNNQILPFRSFILEQIGFVVFQLQYNGKEDSLTLSFDEFLSTLGDAESMGFNVGWLKSRIIAFRDLKKAGPSIHASLTLFQQLRVKRIACINRAKETKSIIDLHNTLITQLQESLAKLQEDLSSKPEASSAPQTQLEGVAAEQSSLDKEIEKLEGELGALSHPNFSLENISALADII